MKHTFIIILIAFIPSLVACKQTNNNEEVKELTEVEKTFNNYCLGCHNDKKSSFVDRKWLWGNEKDDLFNSIKHGRVAHGMPSFSDGLSDSAIYVLTDYILGLSTMVPLLDDETVNSQDGIVISESQKFKVDTVVSGLEVPWGLEFLPNGDLLIAERKGELYRFTKDKKLQQVNGLPPIKAGGQGGLLDLELHPQYKQNGWLYFAYSSPNEQNNKIGNTAIMRARLQGNQLVDKQRIFKAMPETNKRHHWGCKLEFDQQGYLYFSVGDRGNRDRNPQALDNHCGKIHRINDDGSIPEDNPFVLHENAMPTIYSYGHRNPQGVCMHPVTGRIWTDEHGPKGGDEINLISPAKNYGWPVISFGINYNGTTFTNDTAKAGMEQPITYWVPSIAPCGMTFVKGDRYPNWENNILTGSLRFEYLHRVVLNGEAVAHEEKLLQGIGRVRNVEMSPDGYIYVAIEKPGKILKLVPMN
ncbi:PQQ-dependent sugar dehydrogenase [Labilibacter marinus]|uniref:PQQ-dependent sugar dehydrogenase n=1 Tax=Labilibacter marinus TaxID=1477105 RepID=UPI00082995A9|nr:PQQ-dependent sugar dehydrogenase [Labilibacter marinus]